MCSFLDIYNYIFFPKFLLDFINYCNDSSNSAFGCDFNLNKLSIYLSILHVCEAFLDNFVVSARRINLTFTVMQVRKPNCEHLWDSHCTIVLTVFCVCPTSKPHALKWPSFNRRNRCHIFIAYFIASKNDCRCWGDSGKSIRKSQYYIIVSCWMQLVALWRSSLTVYVISTTHIVLFLIRSGGNKRKLSTAIALVGNPPIVFLVS